MLVNLNISEQKVKEIKSKLMQEFGSESMVEFILPKDPIEVIPGIYVVPLNFDHVINLISTEKIYDQSWSFSGGKEMADSHDLTKFRELAESGYDIRSNYGVCDNYEQVLNQYPELQNSNKKFVVSLTPMTKSEEPESGGWRWHKWGEYIGEQNPTHEYLYDEPEIEEVFVYHIYELE